MRALLVPSGEGALVAAAPPVPVREILRRFWPDARPFRRWIPLGLLLIAIGAAIETSGWSSPGTSTWSTTSLNIQISAVSMIAPTAISTRPSGIHLR